MATHTIIAPSKAEWTKLSEVRGDNYALAGVAADCILAAAGVPPYRLSVPPSRDIPLPSDLYVFIVNRRGERCVRRKSEHLAKNWIIEAFMGGHAPQAHLNNDYSECSNTVGLGTLADIRSRATGEDQIAFAENVELAGGDTKLEESLMSDLPELASAPNARPQKRPPKFVCGRGHTLTYAREYCIKCDNETKGPGGVHSLEEVREKIREVGSALSKQDASAVLLRYGNGAKTMLDLEPEYYDHVYARCLVALSPPPRSSSLPVVIPAVPELDVPGLGAAKPAKPLSDWQYGSHIDSLPTNAPLGGKYTRDQVREKIREVACNMNLGKQTAWDILDQDGDGVRRVTDLTPENYDPVYEACVVALWECRDGAAPQPEPAHPNPFKGVTDYRLEPWDGLGDALVGINPTSGEISVIGVFNDQRRAEFIRDLLLQATNGRASPEKDQARGHHR